MKYFSYKEFQRSATADRLKIDNCIPAGAKCNITALVDNVLDPLREAWGKPLTVTSGYRCPALNKAVGGSRTSQHMTGQAADISTGNIVDNARLFHLIIDSKLPFDQLIFEKGDINVGPAWVHVSYRADGKNRRQILYM